MKLRIKTNRGMKGSGYIRKVIVLIFLWVMPILFFTGNAWALNEYTGTGTFVTTYSEGGFTASCTCPVEMTFDLYTGQFYAHLIYYATTYNTYYDDDGLTGIDVKCKESGTPGNNYWIQGFHSGGAITQLDSAYCPSCTLNGGTYDDVEVKNFSYTQSQTNSGVTVTKKFTFPSLPNVNPPVVDHFTISRIDSSQFVGDYFSITVTAYDKNGAIAPYNGTVTLSATAAISTTAITLVNGKATLDVTISEPSESAAITATGEGKSVTSNSFEVIQGVCGTVPQGFRTGNSLKPKETGGVVTLTNIVGDVEIRRACQEDWESAEENMKLSKQDFISTGVKSRATLTFGKTGKIVVKEMTQLKVARLIYMSNESQAEFQLRIGSVNAVVNKNVVAKTSFKVKMPGGNIASVRGTKFQITHDDNSGTLLKVLEGSMSCLPVFQAGEIIVNSGQRLTVTDTSASAVEDMSANELAELNTELQALTEVSGTALINNDAQSTTSREVTLSISASYDTPLNGYFISENPAAPMLTDFTSFTAITGYSAADPYTLSTGHGIKTVYVWLRDVSDNMILFKSDIIAYNTSSGLTRVSGDQFNGQGGPWTLSGSPYVVSGDIQVPQGKTLTIDPGVEVKFDGRYGIDVFGTLIANGTETQKITFTSNNSTPARGNWKSVYFEPGSGISSMNYCIVEYGGGDTTWGWANIAISGVSTVTVTNTISRYSYDAGIHVFDKANPTITNSEFSYNRYDGINIQADSYPVFRNNSAHHNDRWNGITVEGGDITKSGTWYSDNVPYVIADSGATSGNRTIAAGVILTIEPGTVIKLRDNGTVTIKVSGTLNAQGTAEKPIIFTSLNDDGYFGDTNNNGPSSGSPGDWEVLEFAPESNNNILVYCTFKYGGKNYAIIGIQTSSIRFENNIVTGSAYDGVSVENASPAISGNRVINNRRDGISCDNASPAITSNIITGNAGGDGVYAINGSNPVITNNELWGNKSNGVNNDDSSKCIDARNNWWGDASGPYDNTNDTGTCPGYNPSGKGDQASSYVNYANWKNVSPSGVGPVQWWPFSENDGLPVYDSTPYRNTGMIFGPTRVDAKSCGKALNFNGTDNYVELPAPGFFGQGSISGWISFNSIGTGVDYLGLTAYKLGSSSKKDTLDFGIDTTTRNLYFGIYSSGWKNADSGISPQANRWYHFAGTWGPNGMKLYIDGELKGQNTYTGGIPSDTKYFYLGTNSYGGYANALMDEIRVYNYAQSQAEIRADIAKCSPATSGDITPPDTSTSVPGGSYGTAQTVALASETGATIYYTTDGADPRTSATRTQYTGPISITATTTLKYYAVDRAGNAETVKTATYTIAATGTYSLTVTKSGTGTVTSNPSGISCGSTCSYSYSAGIVITLTATPGSGSTFTGWSGGGCTGTGACTVTMSSNTTVTAAFTSSSGGTVTKLPRTGQTKCYDAIGTEDACAGTGQDGEIQAGVAWPSPRFVDNGNGTITDNLTGLIWLKNANCFEVKTWSDALTSANNLANGQCGLTDGSKAEDWRLPNVIELGSLVHTGQSAPSEWLNSQGFSNVSYDYYWSSTTVASSYNGGQAWMVSMWYGGLGYSAKGNRYYVWPVRSGQGDSTISLPKTGQTTSYATGDDGDLEKGVVWASPRFNDNSDGTVTDNLTGLVWLQNANCAGTTKIWSNALTSANTLASGQCNLTDGSRAGDWRLPNSNELMSLIDRSLYNPVLPSGQPFTNVQPDYYWSCTTRADSTDNIWSVDVQNGHLVANDKTLYYYVWPVRSVQSGNPATLTIAKTGTGTGTVTSSPSGIDCGAACSASYVSSTSVILTATPVSGSTFTGWGGACASSGSATTCTLAMDASKNVTAVFNISTGEEIRSVSLSIGWNFISFPKQPLETAIDKVLKDISVNIRVVWGYDNAGKQWKKYKPSAIGNALSTIESGKGYWVYMDTSGNIDISKWDTQSKTMPLSEGWNLIGYNGTDSQTFDSSYISSSGLADKWVVIWTWGNGQWYAKHSTITEFPALPLSILNQGKAYWIKMSTAQPVDWAQ